MTPLKGVVDAAGRVLVPLHLRANPQAQFLQVEGWIDTGFTGDLVLSQATISSLGLPLSGTALAQLADGSTVTVTRYSCLIDWLDKDLQVEAVANDGRFPLIGFGLLRGHKLTIDYSTQSVSIQ
jgi:clan AA aspartic protease